MTIDTTRDDHGSDRLEQIDTLARRVADAYVPAVADGRDPDAAIKRFVARPDPEDPERYPRWLRDGASYTVASSLPPGCEPLAESAAAGEDFRPDGWVYAGPGSDAVRRRRWCIDLRPRRTPSLHAQRLWYARAFAELGPAARLRDRLRSRLVAADDALCALAARHLRAGMARLLVPWRGPPPSYVREREPKRAEETPSWLVYRFDRSAHGDRNFVYHEVLRPRCDTLADAVALAGISDEAETRSREALAVHRAYWYVFDLARREALARDALAWVVLRHAERAGIPHDASVVCARIDGRHRVWSCDANGTLREIESVFALPEE